MAEPKGREIMEHVQASGTHCTRSLSVAETEFHAGVKRRSTLLRAKSMMIDSGEIPAEKRKGPQNSQSESTTETSRNVQDGMWL